MKTTITTLCFLLCSLCSFGQMSYYLTVNGLLHINHFNAYRDPSPGLPFNDHNPGLEFKVERNRAGLSAYFNYQNVAYDHPEVVDSRKGHTLSISHLQLGMNAYYKLIDHKRITISPFAGAHWGDFSAMHIWAYYGFEADMDFWQASTLGFQTGLNLTVPIWKGLYASSNLRYSIYPFTEHKLFRNNLIWEAGIGYKLQGKRK